MTSITPVILWAPRQGGHSLHALYLSADEEYYSLCGVRGPWRENEKQHNDRCPYCLRVLGEE